MTLSIKDLTGGGIEEAGLYDELMRTSKSHLQEEYDASRITGVEYSTVYLGTMQSNLQAANQFLLQYQVTNAQLLLLQEQINQAKKQNELLELQKTQLGLQNSISQFNLNFTIPEQYAQLQEQTKLITAQTGQATAQTTLLGAQLTQLNSQATLTGKQEALVNEQITSAKDQTTLPSAGINKAQYDKLVTEKEVLAQRKITETAQTTGTVTGSGGSITSSVGGVLGEQMKLVHTQKDGFIRDAEQKAAKIFSDAFSIVHSITPEEVVNGPEAFGLGKDNSNQVMDNLRAGINLPLNPVV